MIEATIQSLLSKLGFKLVRNVVDLSRVVPEIDLQQRRILDAASTYTMTTVESQWALLNSIEYVTAAQIEGDVVECGVWRGGNLIIAALALEKCNADRKIWAYDTYEGMSSPTNLDRSMSSGALATERFEAKRRREFSSWCYSPLQEVRANVERNAPSADMQYVKGKVEDTLKIECNIPNKIAVLRLDTDWYESTRVELEVLYSRLSSGGALFLDDYGAWSGSKLAIDEFFKEEHVWLHRIDKSCRLLIKP